MRLAYLSAVEVPSSSAASINVMKMCSALVATGHEVTLYCRIAPAPLDAVFEHYGADHPFDIIRKKWPAIRWLGGPIYGLSVARDIRIRQRPGLAYARDLYSATFVSRMGVPLVYETHEAPANRARLALERRLFKRHELRRHVATTHALAREYERLVTRSSADKVIAPNGADLAPASSHSSRTLGSSDRLQVGYVGHLYPGRGMELIAELAARLPHVDFHVVGGTPEWIEYWRQRLVGVGVRIHGFKAPSELTAFYESFDCVLAPYQRRLAVHGSKDMHAPRWASPMKIFEYMAHGKAIVASNLPVIREILREGDNALLCPPTDVEAWVTAIERLATDDDLRMKLGERARKDQESKYTWEGRARKVLDGLSV